MNTLKTTFLRILSVDELAGGMAHELAHVKNRDILISTIAATFAGAITYLAHMFIVNPLTGGGLMSLFSTHPPMQERVVRLQEMSRRHTY